MSTKAHSRAFTLIEVLFALAIVATAITALTKAGVDYANSANYLRDKTFARWVATDKLTEMQIVNAWPDIGKEEGERELAGQTWFWRVTTARVEDA